MIATIVIGLVIVLFFANGIRKMIKTSQQGCCGSSDCKVDKIKLQDTNKSHYSYTTEFEVSDMHCANCATKIANSLNKQDNTYAEINLSSKKVKVFSKEEPDVQQLRSVIVSAGYSAKLI